MQRHTYAKRWLDYLSTSAFLFHKYSTIILIYITHMSQWEHDNICIFNSMFAKCSAVSSSPYSPPAMDLPTDIHFPFCQTHFERVSSFLFFLCSTWPLSNIRCGRSVDCSQPIRPSKSIDRNLSRIRRLALHQTASCFDFHYAESIPFKQ